MEQWALSEQSFELKKILNNGAFFYLKQKNKSETREKNKKQLKKNFEKA